MKSTEINGNEINEINGINGNEKNEMKCKSNEINASKSNEKSPIWLSLDALISGILVFLCKIR